VIVTRVHEYVRGRVVKAARDGEDGKFVSGMIRGDVLLYRIDDATFVAGAPVVSGNSTEIAAAHVPDARDIAVNLENKFLAAADDACRDHLPGYVDHRPIPDRPLN
jgi:hypothetical protein